MAVPHLYYHGFTPGVPPVTVPLIAPGFAFDTEVFMQTAVCRIMLAANNVLPAAGAAVPKTVIQTVLTVGATTVWEWWSYATPFTSDDLALPIDIGGQGFQLPAGTDIHFSCVSGAVSGGTLINFRVDVAITCDIIGINPV